jgi:hypothetical protein
VLKWSPIADELKRLDEEIVINSVRFHWQEIRRAFARHADPEAILGLVGRKASAERARRLLSVPPTPMIGPKPPCQERSLRPSSGA